VLVVIDTLRADAVSAYGAVEGTTPAFDALAREGVLYTRAFASSPWTLPSHASLLTGLDVDRHGVGPGGRMGLRAEVTTLAERLREAGYQTAGFSENPLVSDLFGFEQGFEHFSALTAEGAAYEEAHPGSTRYDIVGELQAFAAQRDRTRPYFLFANLFDSHAPYLNRRANRFVVGDRALGAEWTYDALKKVGHRICSRLPSEDDVAMLHGLYHGDVAVADAKLAKLEAIARELAGGGALIVVATADHGEHFGEHRLMSHEFTLRTAALQIPLVVRGVPGAAAGRIDAPVTLVDVSRSILEWAGARTAPELAGRALPLGAQSAEAPGVDLYAVYSDETLRVPEAWEQGMQPSRQAVNARRAGCYESDRVFGNMVSLTRWPFKLIWFERYPAELYDLSWDPGERSDLAKLRPEIAGPMLEDVERYVKRIGLGATTRAGETLSAEELEALRSLGYIE
jgi:arylsulfatase A-like enzyme